MKRFLVTAETHPMTASLTHLPRRRLQAEQDNSRHGSTRHQPLFVRDDDWHRRHAPTIADGGRSGSGSSFDADFWLWLVVAFVPVMLACLYLLFFVEVDFNVIG